MQERDEARRSQTRSRRFATAFFCIIIDLLPVPEKRHNNKTASLRVAVRQHSEIRNFNYRFGVMQLRILLHNSLPARRTNQHAQHGQGDGVVGLSIVDLRRPSPSSTSYTTYVEDQKNNDGIMESRQPRKPGIVSVLLFRNDLTAIRAVVCHLVLSSRNISGDFKIWIIFKTTRPAI